MQPTDSTSFKVNKFKVIKISQLLSGTEKYSLYQELEYKTQLSTRHALTIRMVLRDVCVVYCLWQQPNLQIFAWLASNKTHVYGVNNYDKILFATFLHIRLAMPHAAGLSIFV